MTQPQQPFGEGPHEETRRRHALADADLLARARRRAADASPAPLREAAETVDVAELVRGHERRIAELQAEVRDLRARLDDALNAQAL